MNYLILISVAALIVGIIVGIKCGHLLDKRVRWIERDMRDIKMAKIPIIATKNPREEDVSTSESCWINKKEKMVFIYTYSINKSKYIWHKIF